jgi:hypothetical protein
MPSSLKYTATGFNSGGVVRIGNYVYVVAGGWYGRPVTLTIYRCNPDFTGCTQVYTGPSVEDTYIAPTPDGKVWFSGMNSTNGAAVGYYDPSTGTGTYRYSGDVRYKKYIALIYSYGGKWLGTGYGNSGGSVFVINNPLDFSSYNRIMDTNTALGVPWVKVVVVDDIDSVLITSGAPNYIARLWKCSFDKSTFSISGCTKIYESPSTYSVNNWTKYIHATVCGGKIFMPDMYYDGTYLNHELYVSSIDTISFTKIATGSKTPPYSESHGHVFCIGNKYVLWGYCGSGNGGYVEIRDLNGNLLYQVSDPYHIEYIPYMLNNEIYLAGQNASATDTVDFLKIVLDEANPVLNVSVSGSTINVSGAYPNQLVCACKFRNNYLRLLNFPVGGKCVCTTADANGNASITVPSADRYLVVA